jgi:hypothetical protein
MRIKNILIFLLFLIMPLHAQNDALIYWDEDAKFMTPVLPNDITAKIKFKNNDPNNIVIEYASLAVADALESCPLDNAPLELKKIIGELISHLKESTHKLKDLRANGCQALNDRMSKTEVQISDVLRQQFVLSSAIPQSAQQLAINQYTRRANAISQMVFLTSDAFKNGCLNEERDRVVVQKLMGQALTLGGLFMGGWEGIGLATFGQIFGALPLFRDQVENAIRDIRKYEEKNEQSNFLCWYRQMLKASALLFADPSNSVINGLDLTFKSGPTKTTKESLEEIAKKEPDLLADVRMITEVAENAAPIIESLERSGYQDPNPWTALRQLKDWCENSKTSLISHKHPKAVLIASENLSKNCEFLRALQWPTPEKTPDFLENSHVALYTLSEYYHQVQKEHESPIGQIAATWQSMKFFQKSKISMSQFQNLNTANSLRLNYRKLSEELGRHLAKSAFKKLMKGYKQKFLASRKLSMQGFSKRKRALKAMIASCQSFDPSLAAFGFDNPKKNAFLRQWQKLCVGPTSLLCKDVLGKSDEHAILSSQSPEDRASRIYFYSLCGHWKAF